MKLASRGLKVLSMLINTELTKAGFFERQCCLDTVRSKNSGFVNRYSAFDADGDESS